MIDQISALEIDGLELSQPVFSQSPVDVLDAPMGGRKTIAVLKIVTALFTTATSGIKLVEEVDKVVTEHPGVKLVIRDAVDGRLLADVEKGKLWQELSRIVNRDSSHHP